MKPKPKHSRTYAVIGTGLIGASVGLALRAKQPSAIVIGYDRARRIAKAARSRNAFSSIATSLVAAVRCADVIVVAVDQASVVGVLRRTLASARPGALVLDVAGLKVPVLDKLRPALAQRRDVFFVGGHPLAGSEHAGPLHARSDLFQGKVFALCVDIAPDHKKTAARASAFVRLLGARPLVISPVLHDRVVASTSALPMLVSSAIAQAAVAETGASSLAGPGIDSATRLAGGPPSLWVDALIANKRNILQALDVFQERLRALRQAIKTGERSRLRRLLRASAAARRRLTLSRQVFVSQTE